MALNIAYDAVFVGAIAVGVATLSSSPNVHDCSSWIADAVVVVAGEFAVPFAAADGAVDDGGTAKALHSTMAMIRRSCCCHSYSDARRTAAAAGTCCCR